MNSVFFIAQRLYRKNKGSSVSRPIIAIAVLSIALGLAVMIISVAVVIGFQKQIREKLIGFGGHIQVIAMDNNNSFENKPIDIDSTLLDQWKQLSNVKHVQIYATKAGIIKTENDIEGIILKGVGDDFAWDFIQQCIIEGNIPVFKDSSASQKVLISKYLANRLNLNLHQDFWMYFIQEPPRYRKFIIEGIFQTGIDELDKTFIIGDIRHIQKLNGWNSKQIGGYELLIDDYNKIDKVADEIYNNIDYDLDVTTIKKQYPQIFDWLQLLDMNVIIILVLMITVSIINMISMLLILILERTNFIGIMKAIGAENLFIRKIFLVNAIFIILKGLFYGNIFGILLSLLQEKYQIVKLDVTSYYVNAVPINLDFNNILLLNIGTLLICLSVLIIPSYVITKISPIKAIRFS